MTQFDLRAPTARRAFKVCNAPGPENGVEMRGSANWRLRRPTWFGLISGIAVLSALAWLPIAAKDESTDISSAEDCALLARVLQAAHGRALALNAPVSERNDRLRCDWAAHGVVAVTTSFGEAVGRELLDPNTMIELNQPRYSLLHTHAEINSSSGNLVSGWSKRCHFWGALGAWPFQACEVRSYQL